MRTGHAAQQRGQIGLSLAFVALVLAGLLAAFLGAGTASVSTTGAAETRVRVSAVSIEPFVGPPEHISAGQRLGNDAAGPQIVVATGVAAKTVDDLPVLSGIVRDAAKGKGNFGLGSGTASQAERAGQAWVGEGYAIASDGKTFVSASGLRQWRPPSYKPNLGIWQSNFESRLIPRGQWQGNGHLDITDLP